MQKLRISQHYTVSFSLYFRGWELDRMDQSAAARTDAPASYAAAAVHPYHYSAPPEYHHNPTLIQQQFYYPYPAPNPCPNGTAMVALPSEPPPVQVEAYVTEQQAPAPLQPPPPGTAGVGFSHYYPPMMMMGATDAKMEALKQAVLQYGVDPGGYGSVSLLFSSNSGILVVFLMVFVLKLIFLLSCFNAHFLVNNVLCGLFMKSCYCFIVSPCALLYEIAWMFLD